MPTSIRQTLVSIPDTGGHGPARLGAVSALTGALGCGSRSQDLLTGRRHRAPGGDYYLTIWGPAGTVAWLQGALPGIIARLDAAAAAATRDYAAWLRDGCADDDHMPAERAALRRRWRRAYLLAYGQAVAARIKTGASPEPDGGQPSELRRGHQAWRAAERDAGRARVAFYRPPPQRRQALSTPLLRAVAPSAAPAALPQGHDAGR